jgi:hypothetical protein
MVRQMPRRTPPRSDGRESGYEAAGDPGSEARRSSLRPIDMVRTPEPRRRSRFAPVSFNGLLRGSAPHAAALTAVLHECHGIDLAGGFIVKARLLVTPWDERIRQSATANEICCWT